MRAVVQRVSRASVTVDGAVVGAIGPGLLVLLGVARGDGPDQAARLAAKIAKLRVLQGEGGSFDRSTVDAGGAVLAVSQFTLHADTAKGNRPSFSAAAPGPEAEPLYSAFCDALAAAGVAQVERGVFGADMQVELVNDGPVTVILDA